MSITVSIDIKYATGMDLSEIKFFDTNEDLISITSFSYNLSSGTLNTDNQQGNEGATLSTALIDNNTGTKIYTGDDIVGSLTFTMNTQPKYYQFVSSWNSDRTRNLVHWDILVGGNVTSTENFRNIAAYANTPTNAIYHGETFPEYLHPNDPDNKYYYIDGNPNKTTVVIDIKNVYNGVDLQEIQFFDTDENQIEAYTQSIALTKPIYNDNESGTTGRNINNTTDEFQLIDGTTSKLWNGESFTGTFTFLIAKSPIYYKFVCSTNHTPGRNINHWDFQVDGVVTATENFRNIAEYKQNTTEYDSQSLPEFLHPGDDSNKYYYVNGHPDKIIFTIDIKNVYSGIDLQEIQFFDASETQINAYTQSIALSNAIYNDNESGTTGRNINNTTDEFQLIDGTASKLWNGDTFTGTLSFLLAKTPTYYQFVCSTNHTPGRNVTHWDVQIDGVVTATENFRNIAEYKQNTVEYDSQTLPEFLHSGDDSNKYYYVNGHPDKTTVTIDIKSVYDGLDIGLIKFFDASENQIDVYTQDINLSTNTTTATEFALINNVNELNDKLWNSNGSTTGTITFLLAIEPTYYQFICATNHTAGRNINHWNVLVNGATTSTEKFLNIAGYNLNTVEYDSQALPEFLHSGDDSNKYYYINGHPDKTTVKIEIQQVYNGMDLAGISFFDASENQIDVYTQAIAVSKNIYNENGENINNTNDLFQLIDNNLNTKVWNAETFTGDLTFSMAKLPKYYQFVCASNHTAGRNITLWKTSINGLLNSSEDFTEDDNYKQNTTEYDSQSLPEFLNPTDNTKKYYIFNVVADYDEDGDIDHYDMVRFVYFKPIDFVLDAFNSSKIMGESATFGYGSDMATIEADATAVFYMSETDVRDVFKVRSDSHDITDISNTDIMHFTFMENWPQSLHLNPMNGMMDQSLSDRAIAVVPFSNKMLLKHDFIRYISLNLFNTHLGVDLFNNETALLNNLTNIGENIFQNDISTNLWKYATNSNTQYETGFVQDPVTGFNATTNENTSDSDICRLLLNKIIEQTPDRFNDISVAMDSSGVFPLPINAGDTLNFYLTISPEPNQHLLTGASAIGPRQYEIKIVIDNGTGVNTSPVD